MKNKTTNKKAVRRAVREYWLQYKKYPLLTALSLLMPGIGSIFIFFVPPLIISRIVNIVSANGDASLSSLSWLIVIFGGMWLFGEFCWRVGMYVLTRLETKGMLNLAERSFKLLMDRDYDFYANNFVGSLTKKAQSFAKSFESFTDTFAFNVTPNVLPMIFAMVVLSQYSIIISLVLIVMLGLVILMIVPLIRIRAKYVAARHDASSRLTGVLSDVLTNILAVKSFGKEAQESKTFSYHAAEYTRTFQEAADFHTFKIDTVLSPMYVVTNIIGLVAAIFFTQKFNLAPGALVVVFSYYSIVTRSFWSVNHVYRNIESTIGEAAEFTGLILDRPMVEDIENAKNLVSEKGEVVFEDVSFTYDHKEDAAPFLSDFSLTIKPNEKVGLVGPSGGGKTTITKLLMRFINIQSGSIKIDGQDISEVTQTSLRTAIAYVPQEPLLFHRSLFENISYGSENATREEVLEAARLAHADEFISKLPEGYETLVGERGIKLSGGQRQRIAIARALLKKASILMLDEATSALDSESEKYIQESLWDLMKSKTAIVIAHRLSTIKHLDRILVLDNGKIVQDGSHDQLIAQKDSLYAKLWSHQSGGFIED